MNIGLKKTLYIIFILSSLSLCIEYIALVTKCPYGEFFYNNSLGGQIKNILPWTTGFSYLPLLFGATSLSYFFSKRLFYRIIISALILLTFDLVLDPGAVAVSIWSYTTKGMYYSVPLSNFIGWILTAIFMSTITIHILRRFPEEKLLNLTYSLCISISLWTWIDFLEKLWVPFFIGTFIIMYLLVIYLKNEKLTSPFNT